MILSTEDHQQLMENLAAKCAAQFSLIPPVPSSSTCASAGGHLQAGEVDADRIFHRNGKQSSKRDSVPLRICELVFCFGSANYNNSRIKFN